MDELLKKAAEFLKDHYDLNEVELTDTSGNKVRVVRNCAVVQSWVTSPYKLQPSWQW